MNTNFDVAKVFQDKLAESLGLDKYCYIVDSLHRVDVASNAEYQRNFNGFYIVRRNESWRKIYYDLFEQVKVAEPTFETILTYMYEQTGNIEASFSSKMLATIFPDKPIWDKYVVQNLDMELAGATKRERLENAIGLYEDIEKWYQNFLQTEKAKECIEMFDSVLPNYRRISSTKKIDCILWSIR